MRSDISILHLRSQISIFVSDSSSWLSAPVNKMVYKVKPPEPPLLYEENSRCERKRRYCLKPIKLIESKPAKDEASVNVLFNRFCSKYFTNFFYFNAKCEEYDVHIQNKCNSFFDVVTCHLSPVQLKCPEHFLPPTWDQ